MKSDVDIEVVMGNKPSPDPWPELTLAQVKQVHALSIRPSDAVIVALSRYWLAGHGEINPDLI